MTADPAHIVLPTAEAALVGYVPGIRGRAAVERIIAKLLGPRATVPARTVPAPLIDRPSQRLAHALLKRDWHRAEGVRRRLWSATYGRRRWYDWGHPLMALVGRDYCGSWEPPRARDLFMRVGFERREDRTAVEDTRNEWVETTDATTAWDGVNRGEEWRTFDWQDDGYTLRVGWLGDDGRIHDSGIGAHSGELRRFRRWFIWESWIKTDWFGLRPWLYYKALHSVVHEKKPFSCQATPVNGSGGYDHWYCTERRRHTGPHRYRAMQWTGAGRVERVPE